MALLFICEIVPTEKGSIYRISLLQWLCCRNCMCEVKSGKMMFDTTQYIRIRQRRTNRTIITVTLSLVVLSFAITSVFIILGNANSSTQSSIPSAPTMITHPEALLNPVLLQKGTLTWGSDTSIGEPFLVPDPNNANSVAGIEVDIMNAIALRLHLQAMKFVQIPWSQMPQALHNHTVDLYIAPIRPDMIPAGNATLTLPFMMTGDAVIMRTGDTRFTDLKSLQGAQVGFVSGNVDPAIIAAATPVAYQEIPTEALAAGRIDAILMSAPLADWYAGGDPQHRFQILPAESALTTLSMALPPQGKLHDVLNQLINQALITMIYDGSLKTIDAKWHITDTAQNCLLSPVMATGCPPLQP